MSGVPAQARNRAEEESSISLLEVRVADGSSVAPQRAIPRTCRAFCCAASAKWQGPFTAAVDEVREQT